MEHPFRQRPNDQPLAGLWLAGNEGMEKKMETTIMDFIGFRVQGWNGKEDGNHYNDISPNCLVSTPTPVGVKAAEPKATSINSRFKVLGFGGVRG